MPSFELEPLITDPEQISRMSTVEKGAFSDTSPSSDSGEGEVTSPRQTMTRDEHDLAKLGYKQVFIRGLGLFENWAATFETMNFVSGIPILFSFAMYTGGPTAAFSNWTMVGFLSFMVSLSMAEIAAAMPTAGGIYFWSYRLGGQKWGPFLSWLTAWWNWAGWITVVPGCQMGATNFLLAALQIQFPDSALPGKGWFGWLLSAFGMCLALLPNVIDQRVLKWYLKFTVLSVATFMMIYLIWLPLKVSQHGKFQPASGVFRHFYNGINEGETKLASDAYCWVIGVLFGAWEFYGYDASVHLAEETKNASQVVARGMWTGTLATWVLSVPILILVLFCMQDFDKIINAGYANNFAEYLIQIIGPNGATAICILLWLDTTCSTALSILSGQRVTYAIARDHVLPFSKYFNRLSEKNKMPVNAGLLVVALGIAINATIIGSVVAFSALTATATIATNASYMIPILARQTVAKKSFKPAKWNLGRLSPVIATIACGYISFLFIVLSLPQLYPVTAQNLNYAPIMIGSLTIISLGTFFMPRFGGRHWFKGPQRTISEEEVDKAQIFGE